MFTYGLQAWQFSLFAIYLLRVLQRLEKNVRDSVQRGRKNCESIDFFFFKSYFTIQIWNSFERLGKHGRKEDYKISLTYFLVTKISKCKLKIQITSTDRWRSRVHFHCLFSKGKEAQNIFVSVQGSEHLWENKFPDFQMWKVYVSP